MDQKISVVINTYNAELHLREVLESVKGFDEVVVCDMESTDHTLDIAKEYGCKVIKIARGDFKIVEPARNIAIQSATYPWVLVVDADEIVTPELRDYLYARIKEPDCPQGLYIPRQNRFMNMPMKGRVGDRQLRFFIREGTVWPPYVHATPHVKGKTARIPHLRNVMLRHLNESSLHTVIEKDNRYSDDEVNKRIDKHYSVFTLFYRPAFHFFKNYIIDGGYKNGVNGIIHATLKAFYQFILVAKVIEKREVGLSPSHADAAAPRP